MANFTLQIMTFCAVFGMSASSLSQSVSLNMNDLSFTRGFILVTDVFYTFEPFGVLQCMRECKLRTKCKIMGWSSQKCHLGENKTAKISSTNREDLVSQPETWSPSTLGRLMGTCDLHTCPNGKKCVRRSNGLSICMTSECQDPPRITSAKTPTTSTVVNSRFSYVCDDGFVGTGNSNITCKPDGTWTPISFSCQSAAKPTDVTTSQITSESSTDTEAEPRESSDKTEGASTGEEEEKATKQEETTTTALPDRQSSSRETTDEDSNLSTSEDRVSRSALALSATKTPGCKGTYTAESSVCYKVYEDITKTYDEAKARCVVDGAGLMIIRSKDKIKFLNRRKGNNKDRDIAYFIDGSDVINEGVWKHSDGSMVKMSMFKHSPKGGTSKNCLTVKRNRNFYEEDCSNHNAFICEILVS